MSEILGPGEAARISARHGIGLLVVYGSRARGDARPASDLDLGAERRDARRMDHHEIGALEADLAAATGLDARLVDLRAADALLRFEIVSHGRALHEAFEGAWSGFVGRTLVDHDDIAPFLPELVAGVGRAAREGSGP